MTQKLTISISLLITLGLCSLFIGCNRATTAQIQAGANPPTTIRNGQGQNRQAHRSEPQRGAIRLDMIGTWYSPNAGIVEFGRGKTTWRLNRDGTYKITVKGRPYSETARWSIDGDKFVRYVKERNGTYGNMTYPYELSSSGKTFTYADRDVFIKRR